MSKKYSRRQFLKRTFTTTLIVALTSSFGYVYARYIEPKQIQISQHTISHSLIPKDFNNVKIVQFSDTHVGHYFDLEQLEKIINTINELRPDIVFFTGDLMDEPNKYAAANHLIPILLNVKAPLGKYAIYGNHDHGGYGSDIYKSIMLQSEFNLLMNNSMEILKGNSKIIVAGLDDAMLGRPDLQATFDKIDSSTYTILLAHEPDIAPKISELGAHLQLSGHSHGGQIQLPFYGPLITPPLGSNYYEGSYTIGDSKMTLYVNRGLGTTRLPLRFLSKPEISVFTLQQ
ncbi:metallophosphoesterase [Ferdinandcohnia quinoae]|uniref:Metallophosphoesterase n=1 Tax=Fredinandcohnia quinoae TaxID=2918902 RepID=A0AAW5E250_9BACI|nr:metallophosphoesterase [Fredinandcohnia sp. SECRCQ15]MCH1623962.1 metallophosphoesterase [Fredinandcohnia sp. SECRCQ15]